MSVWFKITWKILRATMLWEIYFVIWKKNEEIYVYLLYLTYLNFYLNIWQSDIRVAPITRRGTSSYNEHRSLRNTLRISLFI